MVHAHGDRALVEPPAVIEMRTALDDTEVDLASAVRVYYRVERRADRWLITAIDTVYEHDGLTASHPGVSLPVGPAAVAGFRPSTGSCRTCSPGAAT